MSELPPEAQLEFDAAMAAQHEKERILRFSHVTQKLGVEGVMFPHSLSHHIAVAMGFSQPAIVYVMGPNRYYSQFRMIS